MQWWQSSMYSKHWWSLPMFHRRRSWLSTGRNMDWVVYQVNSQYMKIHNSNRYYRTSIESDVQRDIHFSVIVSSFSISTRLMLVHISCVTPRQVSSTCLHHMFGWSSHIHQYIGFSDHYFFHRSFYPQLTLTKFDPYVAHKRMKLTAFTQKYAMLVFAYIGCQIHRSRQSATHTQYSEIQPCTCGMHSSNCMQCVSDCTTSVLPARWIDSSPVIPTQESGDVLRDVPRGRRGRVESNGGNAQIHMGEGGKEMKWGTNNNILQLMSDMFEKMENAFMFADLHLFINVVCIWICIYLIVVDQWYHDNALWGCRHSPSMCICVYQHCHPLQHTIRITGILPRHAHSVEMLQSTTDQQDVLFGQCSPCIPSHPHRLLNSSVASSTRSIGSHSSSRCVVVLQTSSTTTAVTSKSTQWK